MRYQQTYERRAVILMVVVSLLALFAVVGVAFVMYASAEAAAARVAREAETAQGADVPPEQALAFILGQLIYDVNDATGYGSGVRGHSLARTMYGYLSTPTGQSLVNVIPYNGVGRVHTGPGTTWPSMNPFGLDDYLLPNYTPFQGDGFARDPEWYTAAPQPTPAAAKATSTGYFVGGNAPYTYPDLNSFFLAAVRSDGTVLAPSFHRYWLFNPGKALNDMTNPNWTNPQGKYMTARPRPQEHPNFPVPDDATGDVRNLPWSLTNDSIWIDVGAPVMTAPDGTLFKMLVAPCIIDLDNRINLGTAGNVLNTPLNAPGGTASVSNQGWFPSEINLSKLWSTSTNNALEWLDLFNGIGTYYGKYGADKTPDGLIFPNGNPAHVYAPGDTDGHNEITGAVTGPIQLPGTNAPVNSAAPANSCFPYFPQGYGSGSATERTNHPSKYNVYKSALDSSNDDIVFRPSDMVMLLCPPGSSIQSVPLSADSSAMVSKLLQLCPMTLGAGTTTPQLRNWLTTVSSDLTRPGLSPWIYNPSNPAVQPYSTYLTNTVTPMLPPVGNTISFPPFTDRTAALPTPSDFTADWRAADAAVTLGSVLGRIDLNRPLPPFPHMSVGATAPLVATNARYDIAANCSMAANVQTAFTTAMAARQQFAIDIYLRLLAVTGVAPPSNLAAPTPADLAPRRWLAQLAANIVDYIDADEISTPFNFYNPANGPYGLPTVGSYNFQQTPTTTTVPVNGINDGGALSGTAPYPASYPAVGGNPDVPAYWVFGTELPRIVINEVLGEYTLPTNNQSPPAAQNGTVTVNLWVELFNPMPAPGNPTATANATATFQAMDTAPVPLYQPLTGTAPAYNPYQLVIANNGEQVNNTQAPIANSQGLWYNAAGINNNVLGTPQQLRYSTPPTANAPAGVPAICNFVEGAGTVATIGGGTYSIGGPLGGLASQNFMIVGPSAKDANNDITTAPAGVPAGTPILISPTGMSYQANYTANTNTWTIATPPPPGSPANTNPGTLTVYDNQIGPGGGVSVLLRRLANPHLPPNPFIMANGTTPTLLYPTLPPNPYITVDYVQGIPLNGYGNNGKKLVPSTTFNPAIPNSNTQVSWGKIQPYTANPTQLAGQINAALTGAGIPDQHTLGFQNLPIATPFTWLVHLDRVLISPMELLHVSGFRPYELTQRFVMGPLTIPNPNGANPPTIPNPAVAPYLVPQPYNYAGPAVPAANAYNPANFAYFQHYAPWFDQTRRLYRFFELTHANLGVSGISAVNGRVPGKININTLWDPPATYPLIYQAIADPPATPDNPNFNAANVTAAFTKLLTYRTPNIANAIPALSGADRPLLGMAAGVSGTDPQYPATYGFTSGNGINHTLFTSGVPGTPPQPPAVPPNPMTPGIGAALQLPITAANIQTSHPYLQNELLTKIYSRLTTRSNVFAVFLTVGFFQVTNAATTPPTLGPEIGRSEGRQIRHRMFAIVDRTNLTVMSPPLPTLTGAALAPNSAVAGTGITVPTLAGSPPLPFNVTFSQLAGANSYTGAPWTIGPGSMVTFEPGTDNEETVVLQASTNAGQFTATFYNSHAAGVPVVIRGNPGPWIVPYDPRLDPGVVLYYSIID